MAYGDLLYKLKDDLREFWDCLTLGLDDFENILNWALYLSNSKSEFNIGDF